MSIKPQLYKFFIIVYILGFGTIQCAKADIIDTVIDTLDNLTCETQGVGNLLRSEFSHTCIPAPFFTFLVANIVSPGMYASAMLRLKINDDDLFPDACLRNNRIDPNDKKLSFAFCSNTKLAIVRAEAVTEAAIAIGKAMLTNESPWDDIKNIWTPNKKSYHEIFDNKSEGAHGTFLDLGIPFPWQVIIDNDRMCVATIGITGWIPVGCKYIKEPYPKSKYTSFMDLDDASDTTYTDDEMALTKCSNVGGCYKRGYNYSKTGIVITAPLIECIREMTTRLLVSHNVCTFQDINLIVDTNKRESSLLFQFQTKMHQAVTAFLTLYVIIYGFKIVLLGNVPPKGELINFALKIIFVTYFSVGINIHPDTDAANDRLDGMVEWAFPFLLGGINELASWVMRASSSGLCEFSDAQYPADLSHLALWDALDCRLSHYLGLDVVATMLIENEARAHDFTNFDFFSFSVPPYFYLLIPAAISGNMTLVNLALMYPLLVISVAAYMINSTVVCMIGIVILGILAPLFVPMLLFQYTKGYFESWLKLMLSFLLQPMVVTTFMITLFSIYDFGFYGTCKYTYKEVNSGLTNVSLPGGAGGSLGGDGDNKRDKVRVFFVDNNWDKSYAADEAKGCRKSLGYMLNNPLAGIYDLGKDNIDAMTKKEPGQSSTESFMSHFNFLGAITFGPAMLFISPNVIFEKIKDIILALTTACFTLYLMYNFSAQLSEFAADMTEGVSLSSVTINPQTLFKAGMQALAMAGNLKGGLGGDKLSASGAGRAGDKMRTGGGEADDHMSTGSDEAEDHVSSGSGEADDHVSTASTALTTTAGSAAKDLVTTDAARTAISEPSKPFVPMEKLDSLVVTKDLQNFFKERNINDQKVGGIYVAELSQYVAMASEEKNFKKVKNIYERALSRTLEDQNMGGEVQKEFRKKLESMYSGTTKEEIEKIHDRVFGPDPDKESAPKKPGQQNSEESTKPLLQDSSPQSEDAPLLSITDGKDKKPKDSKDNE